MREALDALECVGIPVFVTDGGSGRGFADELGRRRHFTRCETPTSGLWPQIRASLIAARSSRVRFILYTEPDKLEFFRHELASFVDEAPDSADCGIILASRSAQDFATFPAFQQYTEGVINRCAAEVLGLPFDYSYGPFLMNASLVQHLDPSDETLGWG